MSPRGRRRGCLSLFSSFPEEKGVAFPPGAACSDVAAGPHPAGLCVTPEWGKEGCCHGGLCEANSSRVKWEIFIPGVRQRAGQRPRPGEPGYYTDTARPCVWAGGPWACLGLQRRSPLTACVCVSTWWGEPSCSSHGVGVGTWGLLSGGPGLGRPPWAVCVSPLPSLCVVPPPRWFVLGTPCPHEAVAKLDDGYFWN